MRSLLLLLAVAGCVTAPRDFNCVYAGDTVGVVAFHDEKVITGCTFVVQKELECRPEINSRRLFRATDCIVGSKYTSV